MEGVEGVEVSGGDSPFPPPISSAHRFGAGGFAGDVEHDGSVGRHREGDPIAVIVGLRASQKDPISISQILPSPPLPHPHNAP